MSCVHLTGTAAAAASQVRMEPCRTCSDDCTFQLADDCTPSELSSPTLAVSAVRSAGGSLAFGMGMPMTCTGATSGGITIPCRTHANQWVIRAFCSASQDPVHVLENVCELCS